jgi:hypothetical protein
MHSKKDTNKKAAPKGKKEQSNEAGQDRREREGGRMADEEVPKRRHKGKAQKGRGHRKSEKEKRQGVAEQTGAKQDAHMDS